MKKMKNSVKGLVALFVMVMALSLAGITAEAATKTKKLTLFVGEKIEYSYIGIGTLKSVKSNKSKIVSAKKSKGHSIMQAKKVGKATVTVKGTRGTFKYNITVKKPSFNVDIQPFGDYVLVGVKNNTTEYFNDIDVSLTFYDANGNPVGQRTAYTHYVGSKKTAVDKVLVYYDNVDLSKTTYSVAWNRSIDYKYKDYGKKVNWSSSQDGGKVHVTVSTSYKGDGSVYAGFNVVFYDAVGNIVGYTADYYEYLYKNKKVDTTDIYMPDGAVRYEIVNKRAMLKEYSK